MPSLWFCVPAHGRAKLARICLSQLRRTCDLLADNGIDASAVVVACDENLDTARDLGFATVDRDNRFLSRRFNDGIQAACDPDFNPRPADYVVPCGSDDWVDHRILLNLPGPTQLLAFRNAAFVREDGQVIAARHIDYQGGVGIRIYPAAMLRHAGYRPADEDRTRACDTSILVNLTRLYRHATGREPEIVYGDQHLWQIVDWKTRGEQLNDYGVVTGRFRRGVQDDPFEVLADVFDGSALGEMQQHYGLRQRVAA